jgi:hypothetical protein
LGNRHGCVSSPDNGKDSPGHGVVDKEADQMTDVLNLDPPDDQMTDKTASYLAVWR